VSDVSRDPARIERICLLIRDAWEQYPDERLGQLLTNALNVDESLWETEDDVWEHALVLRIMKGEVLNHRAEKAPA
jgi:hypothetical protein